MENHPEAALDAGTYINTYTIPSSYVCVFSSHIKYIPFFIQFLRILGFGVYTCNRVHKCWIVFISNRQKENVLKKHIFTIHVHTHTHTCMYIESWCVPSGNDFTIASIVYFVVVEFDVIVVIHARIPGMIMFHLIAWDSWKTKYSCCLGDTGNVQG